MQLKKMILIATAGALLLAGCGKAQKAYNKGIKAYGTGAYEEALEQFETALSLNPNKAEYYIEKGMALIGLKRYEEAREELSHAVLEHDMELVRKNNKRAEYGIAVTWFHQGEYAQAKECLEKALAEELLPDMNESIQMYLAETCSALGEKEQALAYYNSWLTEKKGTAAEFYRRGMIRYELGDLKGSIDDFDQAIKKDSQVFEFYLGKMNALLASGKEEDRIKVLKTAAKLENLTSEQVYYLAKELLLTKDADKAEDLMKRAAANGTSEANYYLGEFCRERGEYTEASEYYKRYISGTGAQDGFAYNQLAICLTEQKDYAAALEQVKRGIEFCNSKNEETLLLNEVVILEKMGEYRTAYDYAVKFSALFPENEGFLQELAYLKMLVE